MKRETAAADFGERQLTPSRSRARRRARPPNPAPSAARLGAAARRPSGAWASNPHVEATYRVVPFDDREFAVEVSIPESLSATVSTFPTGACHGDCHGLNARFGPDGVATLVDFDDGGQGWRAYDLAIFLWSARAFAPQRRVLWRPFLEGYRSRNPIARPDLDAVAVFVPIRHIWLMGEYAIGSIGWDTHWLGAWFDRQIEFLKNWGVEQFDNPLGLGCHFEH